MEYSVLNKKQKDRMKAISNQEYVMEWEDPEFMDYLLGELPKVRKYQKDKDVEQEISSLEKALSTYDVFLSEKSTFLIEIAKRISDIHKIKDSWYGLSLYEIETYMKLHSFCLIDVYKRQAVTFAAIGFVVAFAVGIPCLLYTS